MTSALERIVVTNKLARDKSENAGALGLAWLVRLRWLALLGQMAMWLFSRDYLGLEVQTEPALLIAATLAVSNVALLFVKTRRREDLWIAAVLCLDVLSLTGFLYFTGREASPFSAFYIVNVAIAARVSSPRVTALVWLLSTVGFAALFASHANHGSHGTHYRGMWVAYAFTAAVTAYFVSRVSASLVALQRSSLAAQRLAAMSTLAASAAHELGTPLGTISILAESLSQASDARAQRDAAQILAQVERCKDILHDLDGHAGEIKADSLADASVRDALLAAVDGQPVALDAPADIRAHLPLRAFQRVVSSLVKNAFDAQAKNVSVQVRPHAGSGFLLRVSDDGTGIAPEIVARLGEPYNTSKPPGAGSGLGLYLCAVFAQSMRGQLSVQTAAQRGTTVELWVPSHG